jgi:hypothetical protein
MPELTLHNDPHDGQIATCPQLQRPRDGRAFSIIKPLFAIRLISPRVKIAVGSDLCSKWRETERFFRRQIGTCRLD